MSRPADHSVKRVTVIGGGFSGAIFAHHLLRESPIPVAIDIVEERARLGAGVAYSALAKHQTTNVPAARMSVYPDDRAHFERWLHAKGEGHDGEGDHYPNRFLFGTYVDELVRSTACANDFSSFRHRRVRATAVEPSGDGFVVRASDGTTWRADAVVLATGNPTPVPPRPLGGIAGDARVVIDPWVPAALAGIRAEDKVLVLGVGLTMGEVVSGLNAGGHRGAITAIARRGRRPERGMMAAPTPFGAFAGHRPGTAVTLLRHIRSEIRRAAAAGLSWRSVMTAARPHAWDVWASLPGVEKRRFARHLRPYYEALRHVMPGPVHDMLLEEERRGRLLVCAASLRDLEARPDGLHAVLHRRGAASDDVLRDRFDVVVNCTGPAYASLTETDPFWIAVSRAGIVSPDALGLGIAVDPSGRSLDERGIGQPAVLVLGTLARGTFGELTGVPELSLQAHRAAGALVDDWSEARAPSMMSAF